MLLVSVSMFLILGMTPRHTKTAITFEPELRSSPYFDTTQPRPYTDSTCGTTIAS